MLLFVVEGVDLPPLSSDSRKNSKISWLLLYAPSKTGRGMRVTLRQSTSVPSEKTARESRIPCPVHSICPLVVGDSRSLLLLHACCMVAWGWLVDGVESAGSLDSELNSMECPEHLGTPALSKNPRSSLNKGG